MSPLELEISLFLAHFVFALFTIIAVMAGLVGIIRVGMLFHEAVPSKRVLLYLLLGGTVLLALCAAALAKPPARQHAVRLTWSAPNPAGTEIGYHVYRSNGYLATVDGETYTDSAVRSGAQYVYTVRSVDAEGVESVDSNAVSVTIPKP